MEAHLSYRRWPPFSQPTCPTGRALEILCVLPIRLPLTFNTKGEECWPSVAYLRPWVLKCPSHCVGLNPSTLWLGTCRIIMLCRVDAGGKVNCALSSEYPRQGLLAILAGWDVWHPNWQRQWRFWRVRMCSIPSDNGVGDPGRSHILTNNGNGDLGGSRCVHHNQQWWWRLCVVGQTRGKVFWQSWQVWTCVIPTNNLSSGRGELEILGVSCRSSKLTIDKKCIVVVLLVISNIARF